MTGRDIVVDLAGLSFVDTSGLIALVDLQRRAATAGGSLRLTKPPRLLRRLLELTKMKDIFAVVDDYQVAKSATEAGARRNTANVSRLNPAGRAP
jgi:anti-anti-sigma factor